MPMWKIRNPDTFPPEMHRALKAGLGERKVGKSWATKPDVLREARRLRAFRACLRAYSEHALAHWERDYLLSASIREGSEGWELWLSVAQPQFDALKEVL